MSGKCQFGIQPFRLGFEIRSDTFPLFSFVFLLFVLLGWLFGWEEAMKEEMLQAVQVGGATSVSFAGDRITWK